MAKPFLSVIVPAYNEERRIGPTLEKLVGYLTSRPFEWEVLVVDNGSDDATYGDRRRKSWASEVPQVRLESLPTAGKGLAVRHGMLQGDGRASIHVRCRHVHAGGAPRRLSGPHGVRATTSSSAPVRRRGREGSASRFIRHLMGRSFQPGRPPGGRRRLRGHPVRLQDVSWRGGRRGIPARQRATGFGFDVEVLFIAKRRGASILEMPIDWHHEPSSKISPVADSVRMVMDTVLTRWRGLTGAYRK